MVLTVCPSVHLFESYKNKVWRFCVCGLRETMTCFCWISKNSLECNFWNCTAFTLVEQSGLTHNPETESTCLVMSTNVRWHLSYFILIVILKHLLINLRRKHLMIPWMMFQVFISRFLALTNGCRYLSYQQELNIFQVSAWRYQQTKKH